MKSSSTARRRCKEICKPNAVCLGKFLPQVLYKIMKIIWYCKRFFIKKIVYIILKHAERQFSQIYFWLKVYISIVALFIAEKSTLYFITKQFKQKIGKTNSLIVCWVMNHKRVNAFNLVFFFSKIFMRKWNEKSAIFLYHINNFD